MSAEDVQRFDQWAVLELMGHKKLAGHITEEVVAGTAMLRIDVPKTTGREAFTKYFGSSSVYCITPCEEQLARLAAQQLEPYEDPIPVYIPKAALLPARTGEDHMEPAPGDPGDEEDDLL